MKKSCLMLIVAGLISLTSFAQVSDSNVNKTWVTIGAGTFSSTDESVGTTIGISLNVVNQKHLYKVRYINYDEFIIMGPSPSENHHEVGLQYGKGFSSKRTQIYFSGGIGFTTGITRGDYIPPEPSGSWFSLNLSEQYEKEYFFTPSIPLEIEFLYKPVNFAGIGFAFNGNLNVKRPSVGLTIKIGLGKFR